MCSYGTKLEDMMSSNRMLMSAIIVVAALLLGEQSAQAHCNSVDGPVAKAVYKALDDGNVSPVLAYAPAAAETEIRGALARTF